MTSKIEIICGDSLQLLPTFKDKEFDYFLTSPPFKEEEFGGQDYWKNMDFVVSELKRITSKAGFMFQSPTKLSKMIIRYPDIMRILIWGKVPSQCTFRYEPILVWQFNGYKVNKHIFKDLFVVAPEQGNGGHRLRESGGIRNISNKNITYSNPLKLYKQLLQMLPKGRVIDPFLGTGTTAKACRMLGHDCVGIEIDPKKPCFEKGIMPFLEAV